MVHESTGPVSRDDIMECALSSPRLDMCAYPAKPSYSHCAELGRSDCHFSTAARVKKTVTPPTDKTVKVLALVS